MLGQIGDDLLVAILHPAAGVLPCFGAEGSVRVDGAKELHLVWRRIALKLLLVRLVVVLAEGRRDVHDAGTGIEGDEILGDDPPPHGIGAARLESDLGVSAILRVGIERRTVTRTDELFAGQRPLDFEPLAELLLDLGAKLFRDDELFDLQRELPLALLLFPEIFADFRDDVGRASDAPRRSRSTAGSRESWSRRRGRSCRRRPAEARRTRWDRPRSCSRDRPRRSRAPSRLAPTTRRPCGPDRAGPSRTGSTAPTTRSPRSSGGR